MLKFTKECHEDDYLVFEPTSFLLLLRTFYLLLLVCSGEIIMQAFRAILGKNIIGSVFKMFFCV